MKVNNNNNKVLRENAKSILFLVWFVLSLLMIMVGGAIDSNYGMIAFGQFFIVFGILSYRISDIKLMPLLFIIVGAVIVGGSMLNILKIEVDWNFFGPILLFIGAIIIGLTLVFTTILDMNSRKKRCTVSIEATIVNYSFVYDNDEYGRRKLYSLIYGFSYNNKYYEVIFPYFSNFTKLNSKGDIINIRINPDDPYEIFVVDDIPKFMIILGSFITLVFLIAFIYYCFFVI